MTKNQNIVVEDFFNGNTLNLSGSSGNQYILKGNDKVYEFLKDKKLIEQTEFIADCNKFIYDKTLLSNETDNKIFQFVKEQLNIDTFTLYDDGIELIEFDNNYATYSMKLTAVGVAENHNINLMIRLENENNKIIISSINRKAGE